MAPATNLLKLWRLRAWLLVGVVLAGGAAAAAFTLLKSTVYASATTEMLVDSPQSALANAGTDLTGYLTRAQVFARLTTSAQALQAIGSAAGIPGNLIDASGPLEINGSPTAAHAPISANGQALPALAPKYKLQFNQNPILPTIDVYAEAPNTAQAIKMANGAVAGFSTFLTALESGAKVPPGQQIVVRQLGGATGGMVDPGSNAALAAAAFVGVIVAWCCIVILISTLVDRLRGARAGAGDAGGFASPTSSIPPPASAHGTDRREEFEALDRLGGSYSRAHQDEAVAAAEDQVRR